MSKRKIPFIEQSEQSECGIASLAMILSYYNCEYSIIELKKDWSIGRDGTSLLTLKKIATDLNFNTKGFKVNAINELPIPCILHINNNHFVVLEKMTKSGIQLVDPSKGRYMMSYEEFEKSKIRLGLSIYPSDKVIKRKAPSKLSHYRNLLFSEYKWVLLILFSTLLLQLTFLSIPISIEYITDNIINNENNNYLSLVVISLVAIILLNWLMNFTKSRTVVLLQAKFDKKLMQTFVNKLLSLPFIYFQSRPSGDLIQRYSSNIIIRELLSNRIITVLLDGGLIVIFLFYMWYSSAKLALFATLIGLVQIIVISLSVRKIKGLQEEEVKAQVNASNYFADISKSVGIIKTRGVETSIYNKWSHLFNRQVKAMKNKGNYSTSINSLNQSIQFAGPLVLLFIAMMEVGNGNLTVGEMFSFYTVSVNFLTPMSSIILTINEIIYTNVYFNRVLEVLDSKAEKNIDSGIKVDSLSGNIKIEGVSYKYGLHSNEVIKNVDLNVMSGEFVAVVGGSGSGKSTLALLMLGLSEPTQGEIYFDGINIKKLNKSDFRKKIGVVRQDVSMLNQSIKENIVFGLSNISDEQIITASKNAEIYDEIMHMPMGFETILSEQGANISGGQRQRIALVRALLTKPAILLLDEATSSLDSITEEKIQKNLEQLKCTRIVIAHRLNTIINADKIIVLRDGMIESIGSHQELIHSSSYYRELYYNHSEFSRKTSNHTS
ncbi:peptidase domain-containing ABC transporter [Bacillus solimangrovi]|nr:peptidase domain-containing ABC transporter [Bacillus solimangrovi]